MDERKILIIDDDKDVCGMVKDGLERLGFFKVIAANNGKDGLHMAKQTKPDLVLLDINMPSMNGFKVLQMLKEDQNTYHLPVVMLTGQGDDMSKISAARLYSEEYITKPIRVTDLKTRIDAILEKFGI
ncbi:MAG: response regulator [Acidobacteria bacterium]|nr:response regulator [Acidobacteriota bacterium]